MALQTSIVDSVSFSKTCGFNRMNVGLRYLHTPTVAVAEPMVSVRLPRGR